MRFLLATIAVIALAGMPALAEETTDPPVKLHFRNGDSVLARIIDVTPATVQLELEIPRGLRVAVPRETVAAWDLWTVERSRIDPYDERGWTDLARIAESMGLFKARALALARIAMLDRSQRENMAALSEECREENARSRLHLARRFVNAGETERASTCLAEITRAFPQTDACREAEALMLQLVVDAKRTLLDAAAARRERHQARRLDPSLGAIAHRVEAAERQGELATPAMAEVSRRVAIALLERAWRDLARHAAPDGLKAKDRRRVAQEAARLRLQVRDDLVRTHVGQGLTLAERGDFPAARMHLDDALALDADHPALATLRDAIDHPSLPRSTVLKASGKNSSR